MESRNKLRMCRLCLSENECFINIFELNDWQGYVTAEVISDLLQFQISKTDCYPHVLCSTCLTKLTDFKLFKECCQKSKDIYDKMFILSDGLLMHQPEMDIGDGGSGLELRELDPLKEEASDILEQTGHYCTFLGAVDADSCNRTISINDEVIFEESKSTSTSVEVESFSSGTMEGSGERIYLATFSQQDVGIGKERSRDEEDTVEEGEGERQRFPEKGLIAERERFECYHCGNLLKTKGSLIQHMVLHGYGKSYDCEVCCKGFLGNSSLVKHRRTHAGYKPHSCAVCSKSFSANRSLKIHMRIHTASKPYKCAECSTCFRQNAHLKQHMTLHTGTKPYECSECSKCFSANGDLKKHMRTHTGSKPYNCTECRKSFSDNGNLKKHMNTHTGSKPYKCADCNACFSENYKLKRHMGTHTGFKPYKCSECSKCFSQNGHLKIHMKSHIR